MIVNVSRQKISPDVQQQIREKANYLCEYCHASEQWQYVRFTVDHIIPLSRGGTDDPENLCLACFHCNRKKGSRITGTNTLSGDEAPLFHPRKQNWRDHFIWHTDKLHIVGLNPVGRATIHVLQLNRERALRIRAADLEVGRHPPPGDQIQKTDHYR